MGQNRPVSVLVTNELESARFVHRALVVGCVFLIAFALESTVGQHYKSALPLLRELSSIDLDKWTKLVENRQSVSLGGPFFVESVLEREAERARMPIKRGRIVWERVALRVHPLASEVRDATVETLLMRVFRDVKTPELFYPDEESLRRRLRALFSGELVDGVEAYRLASQFVLSKAELKLDTTRGAPGRAFLRLEWYGQDADTSGVTGAAATRDIPLDGTHKPEAYDFEHFVRDMNPELVEPSRTNNIAGMTQPWSMSVRERLAPVWDEIKDRTLAAAYTHVQARLSETKGTVTLLGLTMHRQVNLFLASIILLVAQGALLLRVKFAKDILRNDAGPMPDFPWFPLFSGWLARVLTFLSFPALPVMTFGFLLVRFGKADFSAGTVAAALAAGVGGILAVQAYRSLRLEEDESTSVASSWSRREWPREHVQRRDEVAFSAASCSSQGSLLDQPARSPSRSICWEWELARGQADLCLCLRCWRALCACRPAGCSLPEGKSWCSFFDASVMKRSTIQCAILYKQVCASAPDW